MKKLLGFILIIVGVGLLIFFWQRIDSPTGNTSSTTTDEPTTTTPTASTTSSTEPEIIQSNLRVPWEIVFLPDGDMLVTERAGVLKRFGKTNANIKIDGVRQAGEGGLLGMVLHPDFEKNNFVYLYFTTSNLTNKVVRYKLGAESLAEPQTIIENIPGANNHDGGRIAFGPDNKLYITTGDAQVESRAQDTNSLAGKLLRLNDDGSTPSDNPFNNAVYSYGHRNPQGLGWDKDGQLWATEHGRSGSQTGLDELNLIEKGKNYGWPVIQGDQTKPGMETPKQNSGPTTTWAPADIAIVGNVLYFSGLRGESLYQTTLDGQSAAKLTANFAKQYGRIRALAIHDGYLYFSTSNQDGRGSPRPNDDKIYRFKIDQ